MRLSSTEADFAFSFPEQETLRSWGAVQENSRQHSLTIQWDEDRQLLRVRGQEVQAEKIIDDLGALIFREDDASGDMHWDIGWRTSVQLGADQYPLLIEGEPDDEISVVHRHKAQAVSFIAANLGRWMQSIADQVYDTYVEEFCDESPCSRDAFLQALTVTDCITVDPSSNKYEVYVSAGELLSPRLVHLIEMPGELFEIDLEYHQIYNENR